MEKRDFLCFWAVLTFGLSAILGFFLLGAWFGVAWIITLISGAAFSSVVGNPIAFGCAMAPIVISFAGLVVYIFVPDDKG